MLKNTCAKKLENEKKRDHKLVALWDFALFSEAVARVVLENGSSGKKSESKTPTKEPMVEFI